MLDKETHNYKWGIVATVSLFSIFLFYLNMLVPYLPGDDFIFQRKIPEEGILGKESITSLGDLIFSQINFYNNYHYRVLNHTVLQVLLLLPNWVFDLLNTIAFLTLPYCLLKIKKWPDTMSYYTSYLVLLFFIWIFHFNLGRSYFLTTGSLNYTWLLIPQILYMVELLKIYEEKGNSTKLVLLAILNSMSNENVMLVLFAMTALIAISQHKRNRTPLAWCLAILLAGIIFMMNSPSIALRLEEQGFRETTIWNHLKEYSLRTLYYLIRYIPVFLLNYILRKPKAKVKIEEIDNNHKSLITTQHLLIIAVFISFASMAFVPLFEPRSAVFGFFIIILLALTSGQPQVPSYNAIAILTVFSIIVGIYRYPHFLNINKQHRENMSILAEQQNKNVVVKLDNFCDHTRNSFLLCHEISTDSSYIDNKSLANFYKVKAVVLKDKSRIKQRRNKIFETIKSQKINYNNYSEIKLNDNKLLVKKDKGCDLILISADRKYFIVRGARSGLNSHRFVEILPYKYQLLFLNYLEDTTSKEQPSLKEEHYYNYNFISDCAAYKYLLISEYSLDDHSQTGEIIKLNLADYK